MIRPSRVWGGTGRAGAGMGEVHVPPANGDSDGQEGAEPAAGAARAGWGGPPRPGRVEVRRPPRGHSAADPGTGVGAYTGARGITGASRKPATVSGPGRRVFELHLRRCSKTGRNPAHNGSIRLHRLCPQGIPHGQRWGTGGRLRWSAVDWLHIQNSASAPAGNGRLAGPGPCLPVARKRREWCQQSVP